MIFQRKQPNHYDKNKIGFNRNNQVDNQLNQNNIQGSFQRSRNPESNIKTVVVNSVGNMPKTLDNIQEILKVIQSTTPLIEKYGPVVKSLPTMYKIIKSMNSIDEVENKDMTVSEENDHENIGSDQSKPKLYI